MMKKLILAVLLFISFSSFATNYSSNWSYQGSEGPSHWGKLSPNFSLCEIGKNQSPINIHGALKSKLEKLYLVFQKGKQQIINNGHTIQVNVGKGNTLRLNDKTFMLQQFHFHSPSENEIDGKQFPLEAHFVYKNKDGAITVLALMFQQGKANQQLTRAWHQMPATIDDTVLLRRPIDIKGLLPKQLNFYRFSGSLTTPPCSEGVRWIVLKRPVSISTEQINQFRLVIHYANNRPIQALNGRIIIN